LLLEQDCSGGRVLQVQLMARLPYVTPCLRPNI
jgi:hypothetical protein